MDLILLSDGLYHLVAVTKQMIEGIELFAQVDCFNMCETLDYHKGVGLAGNQVGYMKRIVVIKIPDEEQFRVLINPEITETFGNREV